MHTATVIRTILAIETSCDETGIAIVEQTGDINIPAFVVRKNALATQIDVHRAFGGVVPSIAKREHLKALPILLDEVMGEDPAAWEEIDAIAVTVCPGLEPALWAGIEFAKELGERHGKPVLGTHHMQGHLYSTLLPPPNEPAAALPRTFISPSVALIVSGGHTILLSLPDLHSWTKLGETRDDAVGEAYDKVARLLGLPYPGGPEIQRLARTGNPEAIRFPRPMLHEKNWDFSFSGLKTAVLYHLRDNPDASKADVAASFEDAALSVLEGKLFRAAEELGAQSVIIAGGVAANLELRERITRGALVRDLEFLMPPMPYNGDNAAMIGAAAHMMLLRGDPPFPLEARGRASM